MGTPQTYTPAPDLTDVGSLAIAIGTAALVGISNGIFAPLVPLKAESANISISWNGALAGMPSLAILLSGHSYPRIIRSLGMRQSFYLSTAIAVVAMLLFSQSTNYWLWLSLRFAMGAALGLQWVVTESSINSLAAGPKRGTILGIYVAIYSAGLALGPLILSYAGTEGFLPFGIAVAVQAMCGFALPFARLAKENIGRQETPIRVGSTVRIAWLENIGGFVHGARYASVFALFPLYVIHLGLDASQSLQILAAGSAGSLLFQPFAGRLIDRFSSSLVLQVSAVLQVMFCAVMALAVASHVWLWALMVAWGASGGAMYAACITGLGKKFSIRDLPAATTGYLMTWESGALLGPFLVGVAMDVWDPHGMVLVLAILGGLLAAATVRRCSMMQSS